MKRTRIRAKASPGRGRRSTKRARTSSKPSHRESRPVRRHAPARRLKGGCRRQGGRFQLAWQEAGLLCDLRPCLRCAQQVGHLHGRRRVNELQLISEEEMSMFWKKKILLNGVKVEADFAERFKA